jgi:deoxyribose-phosphate aldolase
MNHKLSASDLAKLIDISAVQAFHTAKDVAELARIAVAKKFVAAHVLPSFIPMLQEKLRGSETLAGAPIGFPSGGNTTRTKAGEARELVEAGAQEMDLMINLGRLRSGDVDYVFNEIRAVVETARPVPIKVILEVHYLSDDEIKRACELCIRGGADFVKTATGWGPAGTTLERVEKIIRFVDGAIKVKASGGIRDYQTVEKMLSMGVARFGINTAAATLILDKCEK